MFFDDERFGRSLLCYVDAPLSWGHEEQTRNIYEKMLNYYKD